MGLAWLTPTTLVLGASGAALGLAVAGCGAAAPGAATSPPPSSPSASSPSASTPAAVSSAPAASSTSAAAAVSAAAASSAPAAAGGAGAVNAAPVPVDGRPFVLWDCENKARVEPASFVLGCGDGGYGLSGAHWTRWAGADAAGVGTEYLNDCSPNCAAGHFHDYPVDIKLTGSDLVAQNEPFAYTMITLTYLGARPPVQTGVRDGKPVLTYPATWSERLWAGRPAGASQPAGATD